MKRKKGQEGQKAVSIDSIVTIGWNTLRSNIYISMRASAFSQVIHKNSNDIEGVSQNLRLINGSFLTLSSHLFANYVHDYYSQNWNSDGHLEVLNGSISKLVQKLWHEM